MLPKGIEKIYNMSNNKIISKRKRRCISMRNAVSMDRCERMVSYQQEICGVHKRRKLLYLPDGSVWKNSNRSNKLFGCSATRPAIRFWEIIDNGITLDKLNQFYIPETISRLRVEKVSHLRNELKRLGVNTNEISEKRYYWFMNLLYYLGNFSRSVRIIQKFYRGPFQIKRKKRKEAVKTIWKYYLNYRFKKLLPILIHNGNFLKLYNCINLCDPVSQESFMDVHPERWVICQYNDMNNCWWFDISSAIQLLGSPGSHSGDNPFNRREYPPAFLFDVEEKLHSLKHKYNDVKNLTMSRDELRDIENLEDAPSECYSFNRFNLHLKANTLFESFRETGYHFPRGIFLKYTLGELRALAAKIYESWHMSQESERKRMFPPDGNVYPVEFTGRIMTCSSSILLKDTILNSLLKAITFQVDYEDKIYGCLKTLIILGTINEESHSVIRDIGLCDCGPDGYHYGGSQTPMDILGNIMNEMI